LRFQNSKSSGSAEGKYAGKADLISDEGKEKQSQEHMSLPSKLSLHAYHG
jgi:hypothetical protein